MEKEVIIDTLKNKRGEIIKELRKVILEHDFDYRTFGTSIEDYLFDIIISILREEGLIKENSQFKRAKDKNEFPDLTIFSKPIIALEAKSGNRSKLEKGIWKSCKNSANDLGTLNSWESKLKKFNDNNIFYIFIEYNFTDKIKEIVDIKIEPFYKFIGLNRINLLSYREKDGNLRPKDFDAKSPVKSLKQFLLLFPKTKKYRASRIVEKHLKDLDKKDVEEILKRHLSK